ncbi:MAG: hypothetical protein ACM3S1_07720 [Hyphomicrobiales bacterium]
MSRYALPETVWENPSGHVDFRAPAGMGDEPLQVTTDVRAIAVSDSGHVAIAGGSGQVVVLE